MHALIRLAKKVVTRCCVPHFSKGVLHVKVISIAAQLEALLREAVSSHSQQTYRALATFTEVHLGSAETWLSGEPGRPNENGAVGELILHARGYSEALRVSLDLVLLELQNDQKLSVSLSLALIKAAELEAVCNQTAERLHAISSKVRFLNYDESLTLQYSDMLCRLRSLLAEFRCAIAAL